MISRANIDDAVAGYVDGMLNHSYYGDDGTPLSARFGPGDIPKTALMSMRRDVEAFLKQNERLIRDATYQVARGHYPNARYSEEPVIKALGWMGIGGDFAAVRNEDSVMFDNRGWGPDEIVEMLDSAAWAFPSTELYVGGDDSPEPGTIYFWTAAKR